MKTKIKHEIFVLTVLFILVGGISGFLNNVSFNPDFSMIDALSGATKKSHHEKQENSKWKYSKEDIALSDTEYVEEVVRIEEKNYRILRKNSDAKDIVILSNKENHDYQHAVKTIAEYLESQGYQIQIKKCSEFMMLSLAHAGRFDIFLMSEEE